jgi:hypothetical protein
MSFEDALSIIAVGVIIVGGFTIAMIRTRRPRD